MREAMLWDSKDEGRVRCRLCPHFCTIARGKRGICGVRENIDGQLCSLSYDRVASIAVDPIEKKPLYHVLPGSLAFSYATQGCNLHCLHCQNASLSQGPKASKASLSGRAVHPKDLVEAAKREGCEVIAATYSEPTIFFELAYETAKLAKDEGIFSTWVTNGYTSSEARKLLIPYLDAANVDLKFFNPDTHKKVCGGTLDPVLETIEDYKRNGVWVEVTTLVIPGLNDGADELRSIAEFIAGLDKAMPWHISAFHPTYKMRDRPRTSLETLMDAYEIGREAGLFYIYTGNIWDGVSHTSCPSCGSVVIQRSGMRTSSSRLKGNRCPDCGNEIHGLFVQNG